MRPDTRAHHRRCEERSCSKRRPQSCSAWDTEILQGRRDHFPGGFGRPTAWCGQARGLESANHLQVEPSMELTSLALRRPDVWSFQGPPSVIRELSTNSLTDVTVF